MQRLQNNFDDWVCIFGPVNFENGYYRLSLFSYFLPVGYGLVVLFKIIGSNRFFHAFMLTGLILASASCKILYEALFPCDGSDVHWMWFTIVFGLSNLFNYVLFTWLYIWKQTELTTSMQTQLKQCELKEYGSDSDTDEARQKQFEAEVTTIIATNQR